MKEFSTRHLKYMRKFSEECPNFEFVQQVVALLPWGHNVLLMDRFSDKKKRNAKIEGIENDHNCDLWDMT